MRRSEARRSTRRACKAPVARACAPSTTKRADEGTHLRAGRRAHVSTRAAALRRQRAHFVSYIVIGSDLHASSKICGPRVASIDAWAAAGARYKAGTRSVEGKGVGLQQAKRNACWLTAPRMCSAARNASGEVQSAIAYT
jgi:hypothetical protein